MENGIIIFWTVVIGRFLIPLLIPRYPLPGIIAAMLLDGIDQTIFQKFTTLNLDGYQGYDKALDIYYLTIAYISTMRNWTNLYAYKISAFLFYYRMVGDLLFQLTHVRAVLLIFPNTFEYFFDFYQVVALRWKPIRMAPKIIIGAAAFIWIFIKLPQEWWIHVAQLDTTDLIKEKIFKVPADTTLPTILQMYPLVIPAFIAVVVLIILGIWYLLKKLPKADYKLNFEAVPEVKPLIIAREKIKGVRDLVNRELAEKVAMMALIIVIFAQVIPGIRATNIQLAFAVSFILFVNTILSFYIKKYIEINSMVKNFTLMIVLNISVAFLYIAVHPLGRGEVNESAIIFFSAMVALLVTLYDAYNPYYQARLKASK